MFDEMKQINFNYNLYKMNKNGDLVCVDIYETVLYDIIMRQPFELRKSELFIDNN